MPKPRLKHRLDRKYGVNLSGAANSPFLKRPYRMGQHGKLQKKNISNYSRQLHAKQVIKGHYNVSESQMRLFFERSRKNRKLSKSNSFMSMLEMRLDKVVERCIGKTIRLSRQMVSHKHITVDGKVLNIPSYIVKPGQVIGVVKRCENKHIVRECQDTKELPGYIQKVGDLQFKVTKSPEELAEIPIGFEADPISVVELLSRYS